MASQCKSSDVKNTVLYPYPNVMIIQREYTYDNTSTTNRPREKLPSTVRAGWKHVVTSKDPYRKTAVGGIWTVREIYVKDGWIFQKPKW